MLLRIPGSRPHCPTPKSWGSWTTKSTTTETTRAEGGAGAEVLSAVYRGGFLEEPLAGLLKATTPPRGAPKPPLCP